MTFGKGCHLHLIDGSAYIFRAYHALPPLTNSRGQATGALVGVINMLRRLISEHQPGHIGVVFDASGKTFRDEIFEEYKANRPPAPEELKRQFKYCRDFCRAAGIADYSSNRYEADDIIGTLATRLREQGYAITIISADKDLAQLIRPGDIWWDFARDKIMHYRDVEKTFGVCPELIADLLALSGDAIDNVPGIPGVGYKMASNLLRKYPGVELVLENIHKISEMKFRGAARIQRLVEQHKDLLPMTKQLTTIVTDAEFRGPKQDLRWHGVEESALHAMFDLLNAGPGRRERGLSLQPV